MGRVVSYNDEVSRCTFCGKTENQVRKLVTGSGAAICDECIELCVDIISEERVKDAQLNTLQLPKPAQISAYLDNYVVGQESAKRTLSVAVYNHYKRVNMEMRESAALRDRAAHASDDPLAGVQVSKSNILLLGPTGVGKTYLAQTLAKVMNVPFVIADATTLTEAGYVGDDVETVLQRLIQAADGDVARAQQGIVYIDEIDKIAGGAERHGSGDVSREGVQRDLLPLIEGTSVKTKYGWVKTDHVLFICSGAFHLSKPSDLVPELQGRLPIRVELKSLTEEDFERILTQTDASVVKQYEALLGADGAKLTFTPEAIKAIAHYAFEVNERTENIGARRLYTVMEKLLEEVSFDAGCRSTMEVTIDEAYVRERLDVLAGDQDLSRYVL